MKEFFNKITKDKSIVVTIIILFALFLLTVAIYRITTSEEFYAKVKNDRFFTYITSLIAILSLVSAVLSNFLSDDKTNKNNPRVLIDQIEKLENKLQSVPYVKEDETLSKSELIEETLIPLEYNIDRYIQKLSRNSIVNLIIGILGTIISISILSITLISNNTYHDITQFLLNYLPKLSFVIFIQLFAFFFLRLYKSNLEDARYFQNELTNIIAKSTAIQIAQHIDNQNLLSEIVLDLSKTERNFKLAPGETLLNIEKNKIEKEYDLELLNTFKDFLKAQKKG